MTVEKIKPQNGLKNVFLALRDKLRLFVDRKAEIPGTDPFDLVLNGEVLPGNGILVSAAFQNGHYAEFYVIDYSNIVTRSNHLKHNPKMFITFNGKSSGFNLFYQYPKSQDTPQHQYDRIFTLSAGGKLYVPDKPDNLKESSVNFSRFDRSHGREVLRVFPAGDYRSAADTIEIIMNNHVGINENDAITASYLIIDSFNNQ